MPSEGALSFPLMAGFRRALFGYRRGEVDEVLAGREARIAELEHSLATLGGELSSISSIVVEREREIRLLHEGLRAANEHHDQSIRSLEAASTPAAGPDPPGARPGPRVPEGGPPAAGRGRRGGRGPCR